MSHLQGSKASLWAKKPNMQRALVLQGGGPLGAYEAGAYRTLYESLLKHTEENEHVFDVIAGTSIGAINAAIIVSHVVENRRNHPSWSILKCWEDSPARLLKFWEDVSSDLDVDSRISWWEEDYRKEKNAATKEAARRYYAVQELLKKGARNVFTPEDSFPLFDDKFFDYFFNSWYRQSNQPLRDTVQGKNGVKGYVNFPIRTQPENNEPRLLVVTVDVEEGETVTFDSYSEKSEYGRYYQESAQYEHTMNYPQGLMVEHIMASASVPLLYDYQWVPKDYDYLKPEKGEVQDPTRQNSRRFWDGALLSNTPTRELISNHKLFWEKNTRFENNGKTLYEMRTEKDGYKREKYADKIFEIMWAEMRVNGSPQQQESKLKAADLDVYIVNLWPAQENELPLHDDFDLTKDRMYDVANHDKTKYDLKVASFVTDYIDLTRSLIQQLAKGGETNKQAVRKILLNEIETRSKFREGSPRKCLDLIIGRFDVNEKLRIERTEENKITISNKWVDMSRKTITSLREQGEKEAQKEISSKE